MHVCVCVFVFPHFSKTEASPRVAKKTVSSKPTESLFSDKEEEQDLFTSSQSLRSAPPPTKPAEEEEEQKPKKKRPAGAVPMFGSGGDMFSEISQSRKRSESGKSEAQVSNH